MLVPQVMPAVAPTEMAAIGRIPGNQGIEDHGVFSRRDSFR